MEWFFILLFVVGAVVIFFIGFYFGCRSMTRTLVEKFVNVIVKRGVSEEYVKTILSDLSKELKSETI